MKNELLKAAAEFLKSGASLHQVRVNGQMMDRERVAAALVALDSGQPTSESGPCFVKEAGGAIVATILETEDTIVELQKHTSGTFGLTIHRRCDQSDNFDDLTASLGAEHFEVMRNLVAPPMS